MLNTESVNQTVEVIAALYVRIITIGINREKTSISGDIM